MNHQELAATVRNVLAHSYDEDALAALDSLVEQYETLRKAAEYASGWLLAGNQRDQDVAAHLKAALDGSNPAIRPQMVEVEPYFHDDGTPGVREVQNTDTKGSDG